MVSSMEKKLPQSGLVPQVQEHIQNTDHEETEHHENPGPKDIGSFSLIHGRLSLLGFPRGTWLQKNRPTLI